MSILVFAFLVTISSSGNCTPIWFQRPTVLEGGGLSIRPPGLNGGCDPLEAGQSLSLSLGLESKGAQWLMVPRGLSGDYCCLVTQTAQASASLRASLQIPLCVGELRSRSFPFHVFWRLARIGFCCEPLKASEHLTWGWCP